MLPVFHEGRPLGYAPIDRWPMSAKLLSEVDPGHLRRQDRCRGARMTDTVDTTTRSRYMAAVKSTGNLSTEARMVAILRRGGLRGWRRHLRLPGTPDFCWPKSRLAVFIDGCFWHGCPRCYKPPKSHLAYWRGKVATNRHRDRKVDSVLRRAGWSVIRIWECQLDHTDVVHRVRAKIGDLAGSAQASRGRARRNSRGQHV